MIEKKRTLPECAKELGRPENEVKDAVVNLGVRKSVRAGFTLDEAAFLKLSEHFNQSKAKKPAADKRPPSQRKIGETQITETRQRARPTRERPNVRELMEKRGLRKSADKPAAASQQTADKTATKEAKKSDYDSEKLLLLQQEKQQREKVTQQPKAAEAKPAKFAEQKSDKKLDAKSAEKSTKPSAEKPDAKRESKLDATAEAKPAVRTEEKARPPKARGATIKIDNKVIVRRRKHNKSISRREARQQTAEQHGFQKPTAPVVHTVRIPGAIAVAQLASGMSLKSGEVIRKLMGHGMEVTANQLLDKETAWIIVEELGHRPVDTPIDDIERELLKQTADDVIMMARAPVITVMGHVDHGKTSLLDYLRKTRVAVGEAGGITQHIGAYRVESAIGPLTFIDTPGHALFTQMRAHGAEITDIVTLVVAADDGVKPQTIEAINHAKAAKAPIVVAANKMDKPEADLERVKRELADNGVLPEDWGGDAIVIPVSAASGEGVDALLEALATQAEILELKAPMNVPATGVVIETRIDKGRGVVATLIINGGKLRRGDAFLCGSESGRVRAMWDIANPSLEEATPSMPVEIQGLDGIPESGAQLIVLDDERKARDIADTRQVEIRSKMMMSHGFSTIDATKLLNEASEKEERRELKVVVKADVEGSREALTGALTSITGKRAGVKVVHSAVGGITESDVYLAQASGGVIVGFNVRPNAKSRKIAKSRNVKIITDAVVYNLVENARAAVLGLLDPTIEETVVGAAEVLKVFNISKIGNIAGCVVSDGTIRARARARLMRDGVVVYEGRLSSLRHFKDEVGEVRSGGECGIGIGKFNDIKVSDIIEIIEQSETPPEM